MELMERVIHETPPPIETVNEHDFIESCDFDVTEDTVSSFDINPDELDWQTFYRIYQVNHYEKHGKYLVIS